MRTRSTSSTSAWPAAACRSGPSSTTKSSRTFLPPPSPRRTARRSRNLTSRHGNRHLKPGTGYIEQVEIDLQPRYDEGPVPENLNKWYGWVKDSTWRGTKPIEYPANTTDLLKAQGFTDVREEVVRLPLNTWPADAFQRDVGRWYNLGFTEGLEAMSLAPLTRVYKWPVDDIRRALGEVHAEVCSKRFRIYNNLYVDDTPTDFSTAPLMVVLLMRPQYRRHIVTARKPG